MTHNRDLEAYALLGAAASLLRVLANGDANHHTREMAREWVDGYVRRAHGQPARVAWIAYTTPR